MKKYQTGITFGAFDPIHYGHIKLLEHAKEQCEYLIVGISSAEYIRKHKHRQERIELHKRIKALKAIRYVDQVVIQNTSEDKKQITFWKNAQVIFVGDDWTPATFTGEGLGVPVVYLPHTKGMSSTQLVRS